MSDENSQGGAPPSWLDRIGWGTAGAVVLGPLLGWLRLTPALAAFYLFGLGGILSVLVGVGALIQAARGRGFGTGRIAALLAAMVFMVTAGSGGGGPLTNDFTTDLEDPPSFRNAGTLPANAGRDLAYDDATYRAEQEKCCGDLAALELAAPAPEAFAKALAAAEATPGWTVVWNDPAAGQIEAVDETAVFGFQDDIVIRVRPSGSGSKIDMRSKSRDGRGDLGANAARIRAYLATLRG